MLQGEFGFGKTALKLMYRMDQKREVLLTDTVSAKAVSGPLCSWGMVRSSHVKDSIAGMASYIATEAMF
jgi:hypothetical protein